jgi:hypothetical protein
VFKRGEYWQIRYYDEHGDRRQRARHEGPNGSRGPRFQTKTEANQELDCILEQMRVGPLARRDLTLAELIDSSGVDVPAGRRV